MGSPVEFMDDEPPRRSDAAARSKPPPDIRARAAPVLWTAAAVLCVISSFQAVFTYRFDGFVIRSHGGYDAAGRSFDSQLVGDQGPRYSLVLWVCAVLFASLAALTSQRVRGHARPQWRCTPGLGVAAVSLFVGVLACIGLWLDSQYATYRALAQTLQASGGRGVDLSIGGCLWYGLASLGCALAAVLASASGWSVLGACRRRIRTGGHPLDKGRGHRDGPQETLRARRPNADLTPQQTRPLDKEHETRNT